MRDIETKTKPGEDDQSAYNRVLANSFGQYDSAIWRGRQHPPPASESEYATEAVTITFPKLDPPKALLERKPRPADEIQNLLRILGCRGDTKGCKYHLLIPFYSPSDLDVPLYRECLRDCAATTAQPVILYPKMIEGDWWLGATSVTKDPKQVKRTREQIEKALMLQVP